MLNILGQNAVHIYIIVVHIIIADIDLDGLSHQTKIGVAVNIVTFEDMDPLSVTVTDDGFVGVCAVNIDIKIVNSICNGSPNNPTAVKQFLGAFTLCGNDCQEHNTQGQENATDQEENETNNFCICGQTNDRHNGNGAENSAYKGKDNTNDFQRAGASFGFGYHHSLLPHGPAAGDVDGAFLHMVDPCQALAAAVGNAGIGVICHGADDTGTLAEQ